MELYIMTFGLICAALWAVLCRINAMKHRVTQERVFYQHALLGLGLGSGLLLPASYALLATVAGVLGFLLLGSHRWKDGAPDGITKPAPLEPLQFPRVTGGTEE